jgi:NADPH oxidase
MGTIVCAVLHDATLILVFAAWWGVDLVVRYAVMATCRYPQQANLRRIGTDVVEISFTKSPGFQYNPGQFVQLAVPRVSFLEYHPLCMSSAPHEDTVTLHLRASESWTKKVYELAGETPTTDIRMEGPYGSLSVDLEYPYDTVLLVAGGIGATHCLSVGKYFLHTHPDSLKKIHYVWAVRDLELVREMPQLGMTSESISTGVTFESLSQGDTIEVATDINEEHERPDPVVQTDIYVTQKSKDQEDPTKIPCLSGRPNLKEIVHDAILETTCLRVAVFGCGPRAMMEDLREACRKQSACCGKPTIDLHLETFAL